MALNDPPSKRKHSRIEDDEDELMSEVYGTRGTAVRKMLAAPHKYGKPASQQSDSTFGQRLKSRIRKMTGG